MLSRSNGRHKFTFQQLPLSLNPKVIKNLIIGIGVISSLIAFLVILDFIGLKPETSQVVNISSWSKVSVADILTGLANGIVTVLKELPSHI